MEAREEKGKRVVIPNTLMVIGWTTLFALCIGCANIDHDESLSTISLAPEDVDGSDSGLSPTSSSPSPSEDRTGPSFDASAPRPDASALQPDANALQPDASMSQPDASAPQPDASAPQPDASAPDASTPDASAPQPDASAPDETPGRYTAMRAKTAPVIDGVLSEFANANAIDLSISSTRTSAVHKLMYNDTHLFIAAYVLDLDVQTTVRKRDGEVWVDDGIELLFDLDNNGGSDATVGDFKILVNADGVRRDSKGVASGGRDPSWNPSYDVATTRTWGGYRIEIAVPWSAFGLTAPPSAPWGFDTAHNDRTSSGKHYKAVWWNENGGTVNDPDGFGELVFGQ